MYRIYQTTLLTFLCVLFPILGNAACQANIPATTPASRFTDNGDGTVEDLLTGLIWKKCAEGQSWNGTTCLGQAGVYNWQGALQIAENTSFGDYSDWRLPNIKELASLVEEQCAAPAINTTIFPATPSETFWSSSITSSNMAEVKGKAWTVYFYNGKATWSGKDGNHRIRLVRSVQ